MAKKPPKLKSKDEQKSTIMEESDALDNLLNAAQGAADSAPDNDDEEEVATDEDNTATTDENATEEKPEETKPVNVNTGITVSAPKPIPPKATSVDIATIADHSCFIGGIAYHFKKGVKTSVPKPVKDILRNAGLLMPL